MIILLFIDKIDKNSRNKYVFEEKRAYNGQQPRTRN